MPGLGKYLTSPYFSAANALNGKKARRKIIAYVESYDDVFFWRSILSQFETEKLYFMVTLPSRSRTLERGKKAALMSAIGDSVGPDLIACVDADYDWLRQGSNEMSKIICENPYVFHTYAYAIENLQCWAPSLHDVCVMVTLNDSPDSIDFEWFMSSYSEIIYPLFLWNVLCNRDITCGSFDLSEFMSVIKTGWIERRNVKRTLMKVEEKVKKRVRRFENASSTRIKKKYQELDQELRSLGVKPSETYLYIQGHQLFKETVVPMLTDVCNDLIKQRENEIRMQSKHSTQRDNEIACYEHSVEDVGAMLKKNTSYLRSPQVARVIGDIRKYVDNIDNPENSRENGKTEQNEQE